MFNVTLLKYGTNETMETVQLVSIPRTGDHLIMEEEISDNWKDHFYLVRAVSFTLGNEIILHVEKLNVAELEDKVKRVEDAIKKAVHSLKGGQK